MWQPGSLIFDEEQAAVVLNDADDMIAAEGIYKYVTLAGGDTVRKPDTENGRLFAAAPDLLASLQVTVNALMRHIPKTAQGHAEGCFRYTAGGWDMWNCDCAICNARRAISTATCPE